ncbi:hypothetical protein HJ124_07990 [Vibrio parahaemolyticus]|uniref:hypothetical protein n=2 Tax=Vibrio parahaemolyticus TaxID=670 RepID=UPI000472097D|nr:hypothetical protein [Vibrio parahaemolyticus]EJG0704173.1 hypothetical protein [Vibrio parahaemolyticus]ELA9713694.1 hypothetical protein [Vibrio parahaemolyticus]ELA9727310.1 hypothetical protein [Vibrio parahaemolyticus]MBE4045906.1 hypothetical protein [Vibrio parahaemolyticus]MCR9817641.1 hypothetical protein [Vibrio parahaemolyticus]
MSKQYNQVYEKLVKHQNDYTGMIAYCIYKDEKRKWISEGNDADEFVRLKLMTHELKKYEKAADELLTKVFQANADEEAEKIKKKLSQEMVNVARNSIDKNKSSKIKAWHHGGVGGVFGNFYTGAIVAILVWLFSSPEAWASAISSAKSTVSNWLSLAFGG